MSSQPPLNKERDQDLVSEAAMEFLLTETLHYIESTCSTGVPEKGQEEAIFAAEMAAAKLERMGYSVGYRLCERLAQYKTFGGDSHLEAVKFLCKEFWMAVFRKQIDKLQTNHRGVFVLKDLELLWLTRLPPNQEKARVGAIQLLAFPCGLVRGALANLGIPAVVSCDFLADGQHMAACSFNIKVK
mmetsp:Transcript_16540/g.29867  ORF Transcript_16540/g.29867 Transcript_16540/m.29867 type:complete len:186 (+) Transcript_16540:48-605(+)